MPDFLFPNVISISRPGVATNVGAQGYGGQNGIAVIATGIKAHIQPERQGQAPLAGLPEDAAGQATWRIILKVAKGFVKRRDILTDEQGRQYQVILANWNPLSTTCLAVSLGA